MDKDFKKWMEVKGKIHNSHYSLALFKEGEVWWCHVGENIGVEVDGKSDEFTRPVLIFRKFNKHSFFAFPLTTKGGRGIWYYSIVHKGIHQHVNLGQGRSYSSKRLKEKLGMIHDIDHERIGEVFLCLYKIDPRQQELPVGGVVGNPNNVHQP